MGHIFTVGLCSLNDNSKPTKSLATQTAGTNCFHRLLITIERSVVLVLSLIFSMFLLCAADKAGYSLILLID